MPPPQDAAEPQSSTQTQQLANCSGHEIQQAQDASIPGPLEVTSTDSPLRGQQAPASRPITATKEPVEHKTLESLQQPTVLTRRTGSNHFTPWSQLRSLFLRSWTDALILSVPAGIVLRYTNGDGRATFALNFIAVLHLGKVLDFTAEEIALRLGEVAGGFLNALSR